MKNILLIGDSIRMGYDKALRKTLEGKANVYFPAENCRFACYVLRYLHEYKALADGAPIDIVHWNAGLWDCLRLFEEEPNKNIYDVDIKNMLSHLSENGVDTYRRGTTPIPLSHETFYWSLIINIAVNDTNKRDFDYLSMATNCFQIQQYSVLLHHYQENHLNNKTPPEEN